VDQPILVYRNNRSHLLVVIFAIIIVPAALIGPFTIVQMNLAMRVLIFLTGLFLVPIAWASIKQGLGSKPVIALDRTGIHYNEAAISFHVP
jgi:hypothetical protein